MREIAEVVGKGLCLVPGFAINLAVKMKQATFHYRISSDQLADASIFPEGWKARSLTIPRWPVLGKSSVPEADSKRRMVQSVSLTTARVRESGEKERARVPPGGS